MRLSWHSIFFVIPSWLLVTFWVENWLLPEVVCDVSGLRKVSASISGKYSKAGAWWNIGAWKSTDFHRLLILLTQTRVFQGKQSQYLGHSRPQTAQEWPVSKTVLVLLYKCHWKDVVKKRNLGFWALSTLFSSEFVLELKCFGKIYFALFLVNSFP